MLRDGNGRQNGMLRIDVCSCGPPRGMRCPAGTRILMLHTKSKESLLGLSLCGHANTLLNQSACLRVSYCFIQVHQTVKVAHRNAPTIEHNVVLCANKLIG